MAIGGVLFRDVGGEWTAVSLVVYLELRVFSIILRSRWPFSLLSFV